MEFEEGAAVGRVGAVDGTEDAEVVDVLGDMGKEFADREPGLAVAMEFPRGAEEVALFGESDLREREGKGFAVVAIEEGFGVEGVDVGRAAFHE